MSMNSFFTNKNELGSRKIDGVILATVTDNKDPDGHGRVKLKIPIWENKNDSGWVRIATLMAGKDSGSMFLPEVGDEVLVAFLMGEVRQPYVIGMLWNMENTAPKIEEGKNIRKIKTKAGHEIIFDDDESEGSITIVTKKGQGIVIDDKAEKITLADKQQKNTIVMNNGSEKTIGITSSESKITLKSDGISMKSDKITMEAKEITLEASSSFNMKSNGSIIIKGTQIKLN
jgi:uncharacterized protein involved in type VI secretion and phage assembly